MSSFGSGDLIQNFGMSVNTSITTIVGRVLGSPELKLGDPNRKIIKLTVDMEKCHWNLSGRSMVEGKPIEYWGILDFTSCGSYKYKLRGKEFIQKLIGKYKKLGIYMQEPIWYEESSMKILASYDLLSELLEKINNICKYNQAHLQLLLCVMAKKSPGYKYLKWISETKLGIVTQCCLSNSANEGEDKFYTNLALKINAKLGGSNLELRVDVNHPGYQDTRSPSIAAVVATVNWPAANRYAARVFPQYNRSEKILNFGDVCLELVACYRRMNGVRPERIVIRDGVSEYQFDMVLNEELLDLKRVFQGNKFTSDELQKLIYEMCFTFAKCTKPVSLVPSVYYVDLAAYRGRLYREARIGMQSPKSTASSSSKDASSASRTASFELGFYTLHADLENIMFLI
ncbi:hypothetical protein JHK82_023772 [Glycine max]|nr:hypothetical protein JHK86_023839 [Glycine max]KAG5132584.1 hypothetical protein JHK82_023772 [Glycine max]